MPAERWHVEAPRHYARLSLPTQASDFLAPLLERVLTGVDALAAAARDGTLRVDDELHLAPLGVGGVWRGNSRHPYPDITEYVSKSRRSKAPRREGQ